MLLAAVGLDLAAVGAWLPHPEAELDVHRAGRPSGRGRRRTRAECARRPAPAPEKRAVHDADAVPAPAVADEPAPQRGDAARLPGERDHELARQVMRPTPASPAARATPGSSIDTVFSKTQPSLVLGDERVGTGAGASRQPIELLGARDGGPPSSAARDSLLSRLVQRTAREPHGRAAFVQSWPSTTAGCSKAVGHARGRARRPRVDAVAARARAAVRCARDIRS